MPALSPVEGAVLIVADHDNASIRPATLNVVTAAGRLGTDAVVLVAGSGAGGAAAAAAAIPGVSRVLHADDARYDHLLAENVAPLVAALARGYSHILFPSNTTGKNIAPRVAALLDVAQLSDVMQIVSADTFVRPIYAGNAMATVQTKDAIKVMTVRTTAFPAT